VDRAVHRGLRRKSQRIIPQIGVDEKSAGRGQDYVVVCKLEATTVEEVTAGGSRQSITIYFEGLTLEQLAGMEAVAMDMPAAYINAATEKVPDGQDKIVFDRFHIMRLMAEAVDKVSGKAGEQKSGCRWRLYPGWIQIHLALCSAKPSSQVLGPVLPVDGVWQGGLWQGGRP